MSTSQTPVTSIRLDLDMRRRICAVAPERSMSSVIREALDVWLDHREGI